MWYMIAWLLSGHWMFALFTPHGASTGRLKNLLMQFVSNWRMFFHILSLCSSKYILDADEILVIPFRARMSIVTNTHWTHCKQRLSHKTGRSPQLHLSRLCGNTVGTPQNYLLMWFPHFEDFIYFSYDKLQTIHANNTDCSISVKYLVVLSCGLLRYFTTARSCLTVTGCIYKKCCKSNGSGL